MKTIKLKRPLLIDTINHAAGDAVRVTDERARDLVAIGAADYESDDAPIRNPDHNPLADVIDPAPPDGAVLNPVDGLAPDVRDNPGLARLAEQTGAKRKPARVKPSDVANPPTGGPAAVEPGTTADELQPRGTDPAGPA